MQPDPGTALIFLSFYLVLHVVGLPSFYLNIFVASISIFIITILFGRNNILLIGSIIFVLMLITLMDHLEQRAHQEHLFSFCH